MNRFCPSNIFSGLPAPASDEALESLIHHPGIDIERIVSHGHTSPKDFWYDQDTNEWVIVLKGRAKLQFAGDPSSVELREGDYIEIPAHTKHRVEWTTPDEDTVWLGVHY